MNSFWPTDKLQISMDTQNTSHPEYKAVEKCTKI